MSHRKSAVRGNRLEREWQWATARRDEKKVEEETKRCGCESVRVIGPLKNPTPREQR